MSLYFPPGNVSQLFLSTLAFSRLTFPRKKYLACARFFLLRAWNEGLAPIRHGEFSPLSFVVCEFDREMNGGARIVCSKTLCWQKKISTVPTFPTFFVRLKYLFSVRRKSSQLLCQMKPALIFLLSKKIFYVQKIVAPYGKWQYDSQELPTAKARR